MRKISETMARSQQSPNTDPIQWDDHEDLDIQYYGNDDGQWSAQVKCVKPGFEHLSGDLRKFPDEESAEYYTRQQGDRILRMTMNEVRSMIKKLILEASDYGCNNHSLGFVTDNGTWVDLDAKNIDHLSYIENNRLEDDIDEFYFASTVPKGWIKVSNANQIFFGMSSLSEISPRQVDGLIDMWVSCQKYSNWLENDIEKFFVIFASTDEYEEITVPDFIDKFGTPDQMDYLFSELMG